MTSSEAVPDLDGATVILVLLALKSGRRLVGDVGEVDASKIRVRLHVLPGRRTEVIRRMDHANSR